MTCAIAVMAKAPRAGYSKTRLTPPLSPEEARDMSAAFLRDITENIRLASQHADVAGYIAYAPAGMEGLFDGIVAPGTGFILADGAGDMPPGVEGFGRCLLHATRALFDRGHTAVCVLNSDSPTLPTSCLAAAGRALAGGADRVVLGPAEDGGYYLLGMTRAHASLYADVAWSTERVAAQTRTAAAGAGLPVQELPAWYDVDDRSALVRLLAGLESGTGFAAPETAACVARLDLRGAAGGVRGQVRLRLLAGAGVALLVLTAAELLCHEPGEVATIGSDQRLQVFVALECLAGLVYFGAVWLIRSGPAPRRATALVLIVAALLRVAPIAWPPFLSSDLFRYVWDGRVQANGINPYRYLPAAPQLDFMRDEAIYGSVNRSEEAPTIYPPMAQLIFAAIGQTWSSLTMVKLVMAGFEAVAIGVVAVLLRRAGQAAAGVLVYAWNPLPVWEYAGNGHIDGASLGFLSLALLAAASVRPARRQALAGALLGAAILCKLLPAALFPAFWRRWDWRLLAGVLAVIIVLYAAYAYGAGWQVLGYLPGYAAEEGLETGSGIFVLRALSTFVTLPHWAVKAYLVAAGVLLLALAAWFMAGPRLPEQPGARVIVIGRACAVLATVTTVVISPHYPWYFGWIALFACFAPYRSVIFLSVSGVMTYLDPYHRANIYPWLIYGPCLALALLDARRVLQLRRTPQSRRIP